MEEKARKGPVVISDGTYVLERRRFILRPPTTVKGPTAGEMAPLPEEVAAMKAAAEDIPQGPPPPTPQELAQEEAERILAGAREEGETLRKHAREEGYAEGLAQGVEQGKAEGLDAAVRELRETLDRWLTMGDALVEAWRARFQGVEEEAKDLSSAIAERLLDTQLTMTPEAVMAVTKDALRHAAEADSVTIMVNPKDIALVRAAREELASMLKGTGRFEITEDPKVEPGSCMVETRTQVIDATRKSRLDNLKDSMKGGQG